MYGLIGVLIIVVMLGALAVANSIELPDDYSLLSIIDFSIMPWLLIVVAAILVIINQHSALNSAVRASVLYTSLSTSRLLSNTTRYLFMLLLFTMVIMGSAWQALTAHQQAEATKVTETMRVKAWVTIEGISDSVYDSGLNSGYRQVALLSDIEPLVTNLSTQDLKAATTSYAVLQAHSTTIKNPIKDNPPRILLNAYPNNKKNAEALETLNDLKPGDQLLMTMTLAPLKTSQEAINSVSGFDSYRWLRARHIDGVANIIAIGTPVSTNLGSTTESALSLTSSNSYLHRLRVVVDRGRWHLRQHFYEGWAQYSTDQQQARAVTLSLLTGDRSLINNETKDLYQLAGISHLLAISGTHVLFLAIVLAGLVTLLIDRKWSTLYRTIPRWQVRWWVMVGAAFIYALFTGFDVPAARTAWMLLAIGGVRLTLLPISTLRVLLALAIVMAWFDPYVLWQAGYWLSFIAVSLLLRYDDALQLNHKGTAKDLPLQSDIIQSPHSIRNRLWFMFKSVFKLQCWLFIALLPVTLLLFGKVSLWGLVVNLFAIGLFGWVIVPLNLLAGIFYLLSPSIADGIWHLVVVIVANLHELIMWLTALPGLKSAWLYTPVNTGMLIMALLVMLPWLLPRGMFSRWLALPALTLLVMTIVANRQVLSLQPTLTILPTGDRYITATILQYPIEYPVDSDSKKDKALKKITAINSVSWLFLSNQRPQDTRTTPSSLTADKLSTTLEQQLRTLSISRLEGIVVQSGVISLTNTLPQPSVNKKMQESSRSLNSELLPMTIIRLIQHFPTHQYWQAGRSDGWSTRQMAYIQDTSTKNKALISPQRCEQGKTWQLSHTELTLTALTGWHAIADSSVWDCVLAIDSTMPINVVQYNATNPQQPQALESQKLAPIIMTKKEGIESISEQSPFKSQRNHSVNQPIASRIILDISTHPRVWQLWSLLCDAQPFALNHGADNSTKWLGHSTSTVSADILTTHRVGEVMTYDKEPLEAALSLGTDYKTD